MSERAGAVVVGASSGIGAATARALAADGFRVHLLARRADRLRALAEEIGGTWAAADVADDTAFGAALAAGVEAHGAPAVAVYASGVLELGAVTEQSVAEFRRVLDINLVGAFAFAKALVPAMAPGSRLVLVSSISAQRGIQNQTAYAASKAGLSRLAEALGREVMPRGIGVHVIEPGPTATEMLDRPGTAAYQLDARHVGDVIAWLAHLPPQVVLRELDLRAVTVGPFATSRH